jgi:HEPN domain-containing protein
MDEKKLLNLLTELKDYEEASDALLKLRYKNPIAAEKYCKYALENQIGDIYYRGMVIDVLYNLNKDFTLDFIAKNIDNLPEYITATGLSNVISDESLVPESRELQLFISNISKYLKTYLGSNRSNDVFSKFLFTFENKDL